MTTLPPSMPAIVTRSGGAITTPESLVDAEIPTPAMPTEHDILVEVHAVSVNPVDVKVRAAGAGSERVLGWDASGRVVAVGADVVGLSPGDEVFYAGSLDRPGSYARYQLVDARIAARKPARLSYPEAAALPLTAITAWEGLFDKLRLDETSTGTLLVLGGAGGVGSMVIQLAKALTGLTVIATASRPESREWALSLGADAVVDHAAADLAEQIRAIAPGGVDAVFSTQSRGRIPLMLDVIRPFGQIVAIDDEKDLDLFALKAKSLSWHWELMFVRPRTGWDISAQGALLARVAELVDTGRVRSTLTRELTPFSAARLREAHALVESGRMIGKVVVSAESMR